MGTKTLTVNQLHKLLGKLIEEGHGRDQVCIDKRTFSHPLEGDGVCILAVGGVEFQHISQVDGDGFRMETKRGHEITRRTVVIHGERVKRGVVRVKSLLPLGRDALTGEGGV